GALFVRIPPWVQPATLKLAGVAGEPQFSNGYLVITAPPVNRWMTLTFPLPLHEITLWHRTRQIRTRLRGDEVVAMDNFSADLTFFDTL
ncbi:MAG: hypothetical protein NT075_23505, partial [Chloroflexi bacterium]|nr:hypothetical protein [Chloroflexota bacterium]